MSSWFSMDTLSELKASATEAAGKVSAAATTVLTDEAAREDLLKKLTLNTDELKAERAQMDAEENRKADVKGKLARILPWETLDEEREILCEECKEKILSMSKEKTTFAGPFILVGQSNTEVAAKDVNEVIGDDEADLGEDGDNDKEGGDQHDEAADGPSDSTSSGGETSTQPDLSDDAVETAKMEAKKAKLDPLPPLLQDFDLDAHVGLIERLFKEDPSLVAKHADLGGAGERERSFWRNYFFHCALARYEAGLSVDEIWGDKPVETAAATAAATAAPDEVSEHAADETITFEPASPARQVSDVLADAAAATASLGASLSATSTGGAPSISSGVAPNTSLSVSQESSASDYSPYEMVGGGSAVGAPDFGDDTEDMDDLEAEIARELEGLEDD
eukprot:CAMPEP_0185804126 /NCGR_PEP_ID=MMETSP1322-20130828/3073_1 /TAXON_ID=265543 /ORGANISM="Minutocellus polymorphus, Strain RCC2270" /LENGTH=392 /DNA_ID=CAMNT_0028500083 /DNA_START=63 /DNA_END=1241 /DNA_ORIENTATION=+